MRQNRFFATTYIWASAAVLVATCVPGMQAQGGGGGQSAQAIFSALDMDKDGTLTRPELEAGFQSWFTTWDTSHSGLLTQPQVLAGISKLLPAPPAVKPGQANTFNPVSYTHLTLPTISSV